MLNSPRKSASGSRLNILAKKFMIIISEQSVRDVTEEVELLLITALLGTVRSIALAGDYFV